MNSADDDVPKPWHGLLVEISQFSPQIATISLSKALMELGEQMRKKEKKNYINPAVTIHSTEFTKWPTTHAILTNEECESDFGQNTKVVEWIKT